MALRRHRYVPPTQPERHPVAGAARTRKRVRRRWQLEESIWAPRRLWGASRDFFETPESLRQLFMADWQVAVRAHDLGWLIVKSHHDPTTWRDLDRNGIHDEIDEVREALWQHHRIVYGAFEYYALLYSETETAPGEADVYNVSFNGFMRFVAECRLTSRRVSQSEFSTLFAIVNAVDKATADDDKFNHKAMLNRQEWLQCLVRCAIAVYVKRGAIGDVSDAVTRLLGDQMMGTLPAAALQNSNAFRKRFCYVERTTAVLEAHLGSIHALYDAYADVSQTMGDGLRDDGLLSIGEWLTFVNHVGLTESGQITTLTAKKVFAWSRIRCAPDLSAASERTLRHLTRTDFLEAIVRLALLCALPTDDEIAEAGAADAGAFLLAMQTHSPTSYTAFLASHRPRYVDPDGGDYEAHQLQPVERCVEHFLKLLVRTVEHNTSAVAASTDGGTIDGTIEASEAARFLKRRQRHLELGRFDSFAHLNALDFTATIESAASKKLLAAAAVMIQLMVRSRKARQLVAERKRARDAAREAPQTADGLQQPEIEDEE